MHEPRQFDHYLNDDGPAALVLREQLMPVEGPDGVLSRRRLRRGRDSPAGTTSTVSTAQTRTTSA